MGPCFGRVFTPVTKVGLLDKNEDIIPLRPWEIGTPAGRDDARDFSRRPVEQISFDRRELSVILGVYGTRVAEGEWRDYALDFGRDKAVFSIFRRTSEQPLYRIVKEPALARRQGAYAVIAQGGLIMKRGHDLAQVLRVLTKSPRLTAI